MKTQFKFASLFQTLHFSFVFSYCLDYGYSIYRLMCGSEWSISLVKNMLKERLEEQGQVGLVYKQVDEHMGVGMKCENLCITC